MNSHRYAVHDFGCELCWRLAYAPEPNEWLVDIPLEPFGDGVDVHAHHVLHWPRIENKSVIVRVCQRCHDWCHSASYERGTYKHYFAEATIAGLHRIADRGDMSLTAWQVTCPARDVVGWVETLLDRIDAEDHEHFRAMGRELLARMRGGRVEHGAEVRV